MDIEEIISDIHVVAQTIQNWINGLFDHYSVHRSHVVKFNIENFFVPIQ